MAPPIGQSGGHQGQIVRGDTQGALTGVKVDGGLRIKPDALLLLQQGGDAQIAAVCCHLRGIHLLIQRQGAAREAGEPLLDEGPFGLNRVARRQARGGNRARIHHRVGEAVLRPLHRLHGIEGQPRAVHPQFLAGVPFPNGLADQGKEKGLGDALDAEGMEGFPCLKELALRGGHGDAEISRVGRGQGGDITRHIALAHGAKALMGLVH